MSNAVIINISADGVQLQIDDRIGAPVVIKEACHIDDIDALCDTIKNALNVLTVSQLEAAEIFVIEAILYPVTFKKQLCDLFFKTLNCSSATFLPSPLMHCIANDISAAIAVEIDYNYITCTPVYDYRILENGIKVSKRSSRRQNGSRNNSGNKNTATALTGDTSHNDDDDDEFSLNTLIRNVFEVLPIDIRAILRDRIFLIGRDVDEILQAVQPSDLTTGAYKFLISKGSLCGGQHYLDILRACETSHVMTVSRNAYNGNWATIPDWYNIKFLS
ncbi:hypothetical protein KAFR_0B05360 [Kazachstania africana CBS 2517]|uniref:Uncharacterized protein n=1 Tax=Kazachstania africana (strain ATCC 22294 / BCRC 22015 / CBS 2517 / CECT 1963 / NBRC 1671 / NRRL Y-8276) TaxID=1071382 RepID=H2AR31_KAZAF|nr:hypothetical protein KAFR_0B05360 [Kazachstania africana CBS 2517]CCF56831.1 hypothetical protein KAFR_0B05360 [Kazachstania africana CBS 2517]